jgi:hypothetical protein
MASGCRTSSPGIGTQFTCFTSTKVQILTPAELLQGGLVLEEGESYDSSKAERKRPRGER